MESRNPKNNQKIPPTKLRKRWRSYLSNIFLVIVVIAGGLIFILIINLQKAYKIPTGSMESTLLRGDHIITVKYFADQKLNRGDIIIFPLPTDREKDFVKRIVGLPGEKLEIRQQQVYINDNVLSEPYTMHTEPPTPKPSPRDDLSPTMIPDGYVFVLGDNRENSFDSRMFGPLAIKDIEREVKIIYWSWIPEEGTIRWERIGKTPE
jgi:signal peptidase I